MNKDNKTPSRSERFRGTARRLVKHESQPSRRARAGGEAGSDVVAAQPQDVDLDPESVPGRDRHGTDPEGGDSLLARFTARG